MQRIPQRSLLLGQIPRGNDPGEYEQPF